jgi:hypothetical protein
MMTIGMSEYNEIIKTIVNDIVEQKKNDNKNDNDNEIYYDVVQEAKQQDNRVSFTETKYTEMKTLDNGFLQKYDVKLYGSYKDNYDIINDFLQENQSE